MTLYHEKYVNGDETMSLRKTPWSLSNSVEIDGSRDSGLALGSLNRFPAYTVFAFSYRGG